MTDCERLHARVCAFEVLKSVCAHVQVGSAIKVISA